MKLKWDKNRQDTMLVNEHYNGHKDPVPVNQEPDKKKNTSEVNQRQSSNRPDANFGKYSAPTQIQIKGTPIVDKKDANRFDRRSEVPINRGKNVNDICPLIVLYCIRIVIILQVYNIILEYKSAQAGDFNHYLYSQCIVYIRLDDAYNSIIKKYCNKIRLLFSRSVARYVLVIPMML
jgi:hypothetical protein